MDKSTFVTVMIPALQLIKFACMTTFTHDKELYAEGMRSMNELMLYVILEEDARQVQQELWPIVCRIEDTLPETQYDRDVTHELCRDALGCLEVPYEAR